MPLDPSISLAAGTGVGAPPNPLKQFGDFLQMQSAVNQQKLFPGQLQAQQYQLQQAQLEQTRNRMTTAIGNLAPIAGDRDVTHAKLFAAIGGLKAAGLPTDEIEKDIAANMPDGDGPEFKKWARGFAARALPPAMVPGAIGQTPGTVDNGDSIQGVGVGGTYSDSPGAITPSGPAIPKYLSPSELAGQQPRPATPEEAQKYGIPVGTPITETTLQRLQQQGQGGLVAPSRGGAGGMGGVTGTGGPVGPQNPPRLAPAPQAAPPAAPAAAPQKGGPVVTGLPPTATAEMTASTEQYNNASAASNSFRQRIFPLEQAGKALLSADTGPGSETVNKIKSFLQAQAPSSLQQYLPGVDPNKIANYDEAVKYLAQYAMNQPGAGRSDFSSSLSQVANANTHISNQAARQVVQNAIGIERMQQAAITAFNKEHPESGAGAQYNRWQQSFVANHDPRGFVWDDLTAAQRQQSLKGMSADDKRRLLESVQLGRQLNLNGGSGG